MTYTINGKSFEDYGLKVSEDEVSTLNEEECKLILNTPPIEIKESGVFNDIHLSKEERVEHARRILDEIREIPVIKGEDAKRFTKRSNKNQERLERALKEVKLIQEGKLPKRSARQMLEEIRKDAEDGKL